MISTKKDLKEYLNYEKSKYSISNDLFGTMAGYIKYFVGSEKMAIWRWQRRLRYTEYYYNSGHRILYLINKVLFNYKSNKYGIHIGLNNFGKGLKIMHLGSVLVNGNVKVGMDCTVHINTAIVAHGLEGGTPVLGNNIVIGVGTVILGNITIADGIAIGANSVVNKSFIEKNIAIAGVPAKKISNNGTQKWNKK